MIKQIEILNNFIDDLNHLITVSSIVEDDTNLWTLEVDNTYYLTISSTIEIDSLNYKITAFVLNESITIKGVGHTTEPTAESFTIPSPTFKHGTPQMVNAEHSMIDNRQNQKYPFIWLVEVTSVDHYGRADSLLDSKLGLNLMFFTDNDKANWLIADHYVNAIYPMLNEIDFFIDKINNAENTFNSDFDYKTTNHVNFGDYFTNQGNKKSIISDDISGVQLQMDLEYIKTC